MLGVLAGVGLVVAVEMRVEEDKGVKVARGVDVEEGNATIVSPGNDWTAGIVFDGSGLVEVTIEEIG